MNRRTFCLSATALVLSACTAHSDRCSSTDDPTPRAFIIHGYGATPADHWFGWLAAELQHLGYRTAVPAMPDPHAPDFSVWQQTLADHIGTPQTTDLYIAHSLGTISLLHYLSHTRPERIGGLVLVSGFAGKLPKLPEINGYSVDSYVEQVQLEPPLLRGITAKQFSFISGNDGIVAPEESLKLAAALGSRIIRIPQGGHFLGSDGFRKFPQLLEAVRALVR